MNKRGFTLIELLVTLIILSIVVSITVVSINVNYKKAKDKTEDIFINTIKDAINIYLESDGRKLNFSTSSICTLNKTHGSVKVYKATNNLTFNNVINSDYSPILKSELHNPANKDTDKYECNSNGVLNIYRDDDYVYYYKISKSSFGCLNTSGDITNLPSGCNG